MGKVSRMPSGLSTEAARLWRTTVEGFSIDDGPSLALLENACRSLMRLRDCEMLIAQEGAVLTDRFGQKKAHPAAHRIDCENTNITRALRELGLNLTPGDVADRDLREI